MSTSWTIAIDWDRNGDFSGEHDDITQRVLLAEWFVGMQRPYQLTADGSTLMMRLNNEGQALITGKQCWPAEWQAGAFAPGEGRIQ